MSFASQILPVYGEGNRAAVEGARRLHNGSRPRSPSVSPLDCHLPVNGEDL
jgi:hypothetical protein